MTCELTAGRKPSGQQRNPTARKKRSTKGSASRRWAEDKSQRKIARAGGGRKKQRVAGIFEGEGELRAVITGGFTLGRWLREGRKDGKVKKRLVNGRGNFFGSQSAGQGKTQVDKQGRTTGGGGGTYEQRG